MAVESVAQLQKKQCKPCEGEMEACSLEEAQEQLRQLDGWDVAADGNRIYKKWKMDDFSAAMRFLNGVAKIAEVEDHHPDLHLEGYKNVRIELTTHAVGGLSENDFILAAKIDGLKN